MRTYKLDKYVLRVSGNAEKFLNGLTSNALDAPRNAFVNVHGRIIATFDQLRVNPDEFLLVLAPQAWEPLKTATEKFAKLNRTQLEPLPLNVYLDLDGNMPLEAGDHAIAQNAGRLVLTPRQLASNISTDEFNIFRLKHWIPLQGVDYTDEFILNVHEHEFVSYTKGCFLGQEPVAKVHNRSKPTWKLAARYADELSDGQKAKMTSKTTDPANGRAMGFAFVANV